MIPGKLYIKIFVYFVVILVVAEILIFGLFILSFGRSSHNYFVHYAGATIDVARNHIEDKIRSLPGTPLGDNPDLIRLINRIGTAFQAKLWLAGPKGDVLVKSFAGIVPDPDTTVHPRRVKQYQNIRFYRQKMRHRQWYVVAPVTVHTGETGVFHVLFEKSNPPHPGGEFLLGLVGIGVVIALLIIPVSKRITGPLKQLEDSAERLSEGDLSHRAEISTRDEIGQLGKAFNRMAGKLEKMVRGGKELTAHLSHELRSPLARIRISQDLLEESIQKGSDWKRHLKDIQEDMEELDRLVGRILDMSKLDLTENPLVMEPVRLKDLLADLLKRFAPAMDRKGLTLAAHIDCDQPIEGDPAKLKTVLSNLIDNAVKYTDEKGRIAVDMDLRDNRLELRVTNTFPPLSAADLEKLFDPFQRFAGSEEGGVGLGLAIAEKIIVLHRGTIAAENSENGLRVIVALPLTGQSV